MCALQCSINEEIHLFIQQKVQLIASFSVLEDPKHFNPITLTIVTEARAYCSIQTKMGRLFYRVRSRVASVAPGSRH
jgi:hypothetical protein